MNLKEKLISQPVLKKLQSNKGLKAIVANVGWLFADRILRMGVGLVVSVWVARYLGVEQFGIFNYAAAFVALFSAVSSLGLPLLVIRTITNEPEKKEEILGTAFRLQLFGGIAALLLSIIMISIIRHGDVITISLVSILASVGIFQAFDTIDLWFQSQVQSRFTVLAKNIAFVITSLLKVFLINIHAPLLAFAIATLSEAILGVAGLIYYYNLQGYSIKLWKWDFSRAKTLLSESYPLIFSSLTIMIYMKIDQIMIGQILGNQSVGIYSAATRISEVWYFIPTALASSISPSIYAAKKEGNQDLYYRRISQLLRLLSLISLLIAVPMSFLSGSIVVMLYGSEYSSAGSILVIHIWAAFFVFTGVGTSSWFVAEGLTHLAFRRTLIGALINILLNTLFIPIYGGVGAAVATVISQAFASFISNAFSVRSRKIFHIQLKSFLLFPLNR
jgi:PST family polysaccharide transporter